MPRSRGFDEHEHPRWPRGTPTVGDAGGGRFRDLTPGAGDAWAHTLASRLPGGGSPAETLHDYATGNRPVRDDDQALTVRQLVNVLQGSAPGSVEVQDNQGRMVPIIAVRQEHGDYWFTTQHGNELARSPDQLILWREAGGGGGLEQMDATGGRTPRPVRGGANEAGTAQELVAAVGNQERHGLAPVTVWDESQQEWLQVDHAEMHAGQALITLRFTGGGGTMGLPAIPGQQQMEWRVGTTPGRTDLTPDSSQYGTRDENDQWNQKVLIRAVELRQTLERQGDEGEDSYTNLVDLLETYNDAAENPDDQESIDSAIDDLFDELADYDLADEVLTAAGLDEPPNRPNYDAVYQPRHGGGTGLHRAPSGGEDVEYPDPTGPGELPFGTTKLGEMMRRAYAASNQGRIYAPQQGTPAREAIETHIRQMVDLDDTGRSGMRMETGYVSVDDYGEFTVDGYILDSNGNHVRYTDRSGFSTDSSFRLTFKTDHQGKTYISQDSMVLGAEVQGNGLAARWADQLQKQYRENGLDYVTVHADIDVGGYAWAKAGFDFRDEHTHKSFLNRLQSALGTLSGDPTVEWVYMQRRGGTNSRLHMSLETQREVTSLVERSQRGEHITPLEIALLGWGQRDRDGFQGWTTPDGSQVDMWLGKAYMLGTDWYGRAMLQ